MSPTKATQHSKASLYLQSTVHEVILRVFKFPGM